ncbi:MAG: c-type cytochrome [Deinococcales bacterium]
MKKRLLLPFIFGLVACSVPSSETNPAKEAAKKGVLYIREDAKPLELSPKEGEYAWKYHRYPEDYTIDLSNRDPENKTYMSGREIVYRTNAEGQRKMDTALAEAGSYAGPWLEGEEALLLPVANPNVVLGDALIKTLGAEIKPEMLPTLDESPFQAYLKLRGLGKDAEGKHRTVTIEIAGVTNPSTGKAEVAEYDVQLDKEALWSITYALYRKIQPDFTKPIPSRADPNKLVDGALVYGNCNMCHGSDGWGLGKSGHKLQPHPANFHEPRRLYNRSDAKLRQALKHGIYGSAMPPWGDKLSDAEINHVVAYVRAFSYTSEPPVLNVKPRFKGGQP